MQSASAVAPTRVRFLTLALCIAMAMLLYLDRYAISPVTGTLLAELKVSKEQLGRTIFFAFFFAYALCQIPAGWLSDAFGARRMLALYVAGWSLATIGMGLVNGLAAIFFVRFVLGVSQAGAYPTAASLLKRWIPYGARGLANSSVSMGGRAGGLLAFAATPALDAPRRALARMGDGTLARGVRTLWSTRPGLGGGFCLDVSRLSPRSSLVQRKEIELIAPRGTLAAAPRRPSLPPLAIIASKEALLMCVINFGVNVGLGISRLVAPLVPGGNLRRLPAGQHWRSAGRLRPDDGPDRTGWNDRKHFGGLGD